MFNFRIWLLLPYGLLICLTTADTHPKGPLIIPSVDEIILENGESFTITCRSNKRVQIKQQEIPEYSTQIFREQKTVETFDSQYKYETTLDLYNVSRITVGYYACFDDTVNETAILSNIREEPSNTEHVSYIYLYVNGTDSLYAPFREMYQHWSVGRSKVLIECKPTTPDVTVRLIGDFAESEYSYSPKIGFTIDSDLLDSQITFFNCDFTRQNVTTTKDVFVHKQTEKPPTPTIIGESRYFIKGETFSLNCTVIYQENSAVYLEWKLPSTKSVSYETNENEATGGILYNNITIVNATEEDAGVYTCKSKNSNGEEKEEFKKIYKDTGFINLTKAHNQMNILETKQGMIKIHAKVTDYPPAEFTILRDNVELAIIPGKHFLDVDRGSVDFSILNLNINDTGNYTIVAINDYVSKNVTYDLRPQAVPIINFGLKNPKKYLLNLTASMRCEAIGYPQPTIDWVFTDDNGQEKSLRGDTKYESIIKTSSEVKVPARTSGFITCHATNSMGHVKESRRFIVYEVSGGFAVKNNEKNWFSENERVELECFASKFEFFNVSWTDVEGIWMDGYTKFYETNLSLVAKLVFDRITLNDAGNYTCLGYKFDDSEETYTMPVSVIEQRSPDIIIPKEMEKNVEVNPYQPVQLSCQADAVPPPTITWYKDGLPVKNSINVEIITIMINRTVLNSTIAVKSMLEEDSGKYECVAKSGNDTESKFYNLYMKETPTYKGLLSCVGVVVFILIILIAYLVWRIRKMKQFKRELAAAGLLYFKEGVPKSLNPDLGIDEQAELLPYDDKFEFPAEKLKIGKQLGAGAFGVVYKAEARGIVNAEESTTVAVKTVKKTADNMYIKALASELKIMVHLGKHINIVNLLGACTKNAGKRELIVIVEYCKFGNIHNYLIRHREVFIDQLTDDKEKNLGKVNKAFSYSTASSGMHSDYYGSNHTQATDHTSLNSGNTNRSGRKDNANQNQQVEFLKVSETGYVQPEWRSNYECDSIYEGRKPRPLTSRDLLAWAFQIARGMEYLASRKVLHGDLAARNVLLAEDNIVKICDFGLARSIYKNDEYQKKENSPLPVKWLAIECMVDRIFSTQSDVWSFGIVLWELFSLAQTPYPNISPANLLNWLSEGHRLEKPMYADDKLYEVMNKCWEKKPTARPTFTELQQTLGSFLEDNVRNHYVDLNAMYADMNAKTEGQEDYLAMVSAPDYNNIVTPSPHHYANDANQFFSTPSPNLLPHDDEGYLQMSPPNQHIFSPRVPSTKFDFDARKLNVKIAETGTDWPEERTPMLTLNNLPSRMNSESDEHNYLNMRRTESDEVFEAKEHNKNSKNVAASNPTYIMFDVDKKPLKNTSYINMPNGLVK